MVTADRTRVGLGGILTLSCAVTRTNPETDGNYVWTSPSGTVTNRTLNTLEVTFSTIQDLGTYTCNVTNTAGVSGTGNLTIEQACKLKLLLLKGSSHINLILILGSCTNDYDCPASSSCGC